MKVNGRKFKRKTTDIQSDCCKLCYLRRGCSPKVDMRCGLKDSKKGNFGYYIPEED